MATFDYKCNHCQNEFEAEHSVHTRLEKCIYCDSKNIKRLISKGTNFVLLGDSWGKDNYK